MNEFYIFDGIDARAQLKKAQKLADEGHTVKVHYHVHEIRLSNTDMTKVPCSSDCYIIPEAS